MAWNIVQHAFMIVFRNFGNAVRASLVPFLILGLFSLVSVALIGVDPLASDSMDISDDNLGGFMMMLLIGLPLYLFVLAWVAVTWHRFILLEEYPSNIPVIEDRPIWAYVRRSLMLMLQMMIVFFTLSIVGAVFGMNSSSAFGLIMTLIVGTIVSFFWFRIGISLPAVAIDEPMYSIESWAATGPIWSTILGVSFIVVALNTIGTLVIGSLFNGIPVLALVVGLAVQWVTVMVSVSILTTLYGHVIEGRRLSGD